MTSVCPEGGRIPEGGPPPDYQSVVSSTPHNPIGPRGTVPQGAVFVPMGAHIMDDEPPPEYSVATTLPTYEQSELSKEKMFADCNSEPRSPGRAERGEERPSTSMEENWETLGGEPDAALLGNDFVFFTAFITAFFFNWVGFLLLMCFCHTIAARYGALAGFGLSLAKWTLIVKRSTDLVRNENAWLWWLVLGFGFLIFARACIQYLQIKRTWRQLSVSARERLFFFY